MYAEALASFIEGDNTVTLSILRDLVHAQISFKKLAEITGISEKALYQMMGPRGNPTMHNLALLLRHIGNSLKLSTRIAVSRGNASSEVVVNSHQHALAVAS